MPGPKKRCLGKVGDCREPQSLLKNSHSPVCPGTRWSPSKSAAQSIKGHLLPTQVPSHSHFPSSWPVPGPSHLGSPTLSLWLFYCVPQKMIVTSSQSGDTPAQGPLFTRKLHSKPPLRRGKLGFCPPWKMPGTIHYVPCSSKGRDSGKHELSVPGPSPSLWLSHSCLSLCFLIYESQLGWFLSLFPVHKLLLLLAWSSREPAGIGC